MPTAIFHREKKLADVTRRRTGELVQKLFDILLKSPDGLPARVALERLADSVTLTEYEAGLYDSGSRRFEKIVRFATVDCVKAGWLVKEKGTWSITDAGREARRTLKDPEVFYREALRLYRKWRASRDLSEAASESDSEAESGIDKSARITFEQAEEQAWKEIEDYLSTLNPFDLQHLVADLLEAMGYHPSWVSPPGRDGGIDIIAYTDPLGTRPPRIKVQVKRQAQRIDEDGLRSFLALVNEDDVGLFVSIGGFTRAAEEAARKQERRKITLIDASRLVDLWIEFYDKLDDIARERLPLTPIHFFTPNE
jgi:restriction system protein